MCLLTLAVQLERTVSCLTRSTIDSAADSQVMDDGECRKYEKIRILRRNVSRYIVRRHWTQNFPILDFVLLTLAVIFLSWPGALSNTPADSPWPQYAAASKGDRLYWEPTGVYTWLKTKLRLSAIKLTHLNMAAKLGVYIRPCISDVWLTVSTGASHLTEQQPFPVLCNLASVSYCTYVCAPLRVYSFPSVPVLIIFIEWRTTRRLSRFVFLVFLFWLLHSQVPTFRHDSSSLSLWPIRSFLCYDQATRLTR